MGKVWKKKKEKMDKNFWIYNEEINNAILKFAKVQKKISDILIKIMIWKTNYVL